MRTRHTTAKVVKKFENTIYLRTNYSLTELLLEYCCEENARKAQHGINKPLCREKGNACLLTMPLWLSKSN